MELKECRKIVFVIGNGFDLDLGLKTSYKDFCESRYCPKDYPARIIKHLNAKWSDNLEAVKWYDLENELLEYFRYAKINSKISTDLLSKKEHEFIKAINPDCLIRGHYFEYEEQIKELTRKGIIQFNDLGHNIYMTIPYLEDLKESGVYRDRKAVELIKDGLCKYVSDAAQAVIEANSCAFNVLFAISRAKDNEHDVNVYNFNYTPLPYPHSEMSSLTSISHHIHGNCKTGKIIIGTQDSDEFNTDYDFLQKSFDPNFDPPALVYDLLDADDVVIFGHSIGVNDRQYFKAFFIQQSSTTAPKKKKIRIFTKDDKSEVEIKRSLQQMTDHNLSTLYGLNDLQIIKTANIKDDPSKFRAFLKEYIGDDRYVIPAMTQLLEKLRAEA